MNLGGRLTTKMSLLQHYASHTCANIHVCVHAHTRVRVHAHAHKHTHPHAHKNTHNIDLKTPIY